MIPIDRVHSAPGRTFCQGQKAIASQQWPSIFSMDCPKCYAIAWGLKKDEYLFFRRIPRDKKSKYAGENSEGDGSGDNYRHVTGAPIS